MKSGKANNQDPHIGQDHTIQADLVKFFGLSTKYQTATVPSDQAKQHSLKRSTGAPNLPRKEESVKSRKRKNQDPRPGHNHSVQPHLVIFFGPSTKYQTATVPSDQASSSR